MGGCENREEGGGVGWDLSDDGAGGIWNEWKGDEREDCGEEGFGCLECFGEAEIKRGESGKDDQKS